MMKLLNVVGDMVNFVFGILLTYEMMYISSPTLMRVIKGVTQIQTYTRKDG